MSKQQGPAGNSSSFNGLDEDALKARLFEAISSDNMTTVQSLLKVNPALLKSPIKGYYGRDKFTDIWCCKISNKSKKEYFYPLHVASVNGTMSMCLYLLGLLKEDESYASLLDSDGLTAEQRIPAGSGNMGAFYEVVYGYSYPEAERYEGSTRKGRDGVERRDGKGALYIKPPGYFNPKDSPFQLVYRGGFRDGYFHGMGSLFWREMAPHGAGAGPHRSRTEGTEAGGGKQPSQAKPKSGAGGAAEQGGHSATQWSVAFSPDGRRIVSASNKDDEVVRVWGQAVEGAGEASTPAPAPSQATAAIGGNPPHWAELGVREYYGKFCKGKQHGRGEEFDKDGNRLYKGAFKEGARHGRGNAYECGRELGKAVRTYKGQWENGKMHGNGIMYMYHEGRCHIHVGSFFEGKKTGLGVFYNDEDKSRLEGMFDEGEPNGHVSVYTVDPDNPGKFKGSHYMMEKGVSGFKEAIVAPFVPDRIYIPDDHEHRVASAANRLGDFEFLFGNSGGEDHEALALLDELEDHEHQTSETSEMFGARARRRASAHNHLHAHHSHAYVGNWKAALGRFLKLSPEDAEVMDMKWEHTDTEAEGGQAEEERKKGKGKGENHSPLPLLPPPKGGAAGARAGTGGGGGGGGGAGNRGGRDAGTTQSESQAPRPVRRRSTKSFSLRRPSDHDRHGRRSSGPGAGAGTGTGTGQHSRTMGTPSPTLDDKDGGGDGLDSDGEGGDAEHVFSYNEDDVEDDEDSCSESDFGDSDTELGIRWREYPPLNVVNIYVKTIKHTFEHQRDKASRAPRQPDLDFFGSEYLRPPDFEAVSDLVHNAIESYEAKFKAALMSLSGYEPPAVSAKSKLFENERDRRATGRAAQEAQLKAEKAGAELDAATEKAIGDAVMEDLTRELRLLLHLPVSPTEDSSGGGSGSKRSSASPSTGGRSSNSNATTSSGPCASIKASAHGSGFSQHHPPPASLAASRMRHNTHSTHSTYSTRSSPAQQEVDEENENEFASEILYLIGASRSLLT